MTLTCDNSDGYSFHTYDFYGKGWKRQNLFTMTPLQYYGYMRLDVMQKSLVAEATTSACSNAIQEENSDNRSVIIKEKFDTMLCQCTNRTTCLDALVRFRAALHACRDHELFYVFYVAMAELERYLPEAEDLQEDSCDRRFLHPPSFGSDPIISPYHRGYFLYTTTDEYPRESCCKEDHEECARYKKMLRDFRKLNHITCGETPWTLETTYRDKQICGSRLLTRKLKADPGYYLQFNWDLQGLMRHGGHQSVYNPDVHLESRQKSVEKFELFCGAVSLFEPIVFTPIYYTVKEVSDTRTEIMETVYNIWESDTSNAYCWNALAMTSCSHCEVATGSGGFRFPSHNMQGPSSRSGGVMGFDNPRDRPGSRSGPMGSRDTGNRPGSWSMGSPGMGDETMGFDYTWNGPGSWSGPMGSGDSENRPEQWNMESPGMEDRAINFGSTWNDSGSWNIGDERNRSQSFRDWFESMGSDETGFPSFRDESSRFGGNGNEPESTESPAAFLPGIESGSGGSAGTDDLADRPAHGGPLKEKHGHGTDRESDEHSTCHPCSVLLVS